MSASKHSRCHRSTATTLKTTSLNYGFEDRQASDRFAGGARSARSRRGRVSQANKRGGRLAEAGRIPFDRRRASGAGPPAERDRATKEVLAHGAPLSLPSCPKTQTNSRPAIPKTCKQALLHTAAATSPGAPSTRPGSAGCGPVGRSEVGGVSFINYSGHPGHQRGNRPAQRASGQAPSLSSAVIRPRALRGGAG